MIVIVEDSPTQAAKLRLILEGAGYQAAVASDGTAGYELCANSDPPPRAVISDIVMPGMDGYELCRRIKSNSRLAQTPVMLLTNLADPRDVLRAVSVGADNYCTKPYRPEVLLKRLERLLARSTEHDPQAVIHLDGEHFDLGDSSRALGEILASSLEDLSERYTELVKGRKRLERINAEREAMTRVVAHELRSPLQTILMAAEALQHDQPEAQRKSISGKLLSQVNRMIRIIDDLSDVSQIELNTLALDRERCDLRTLVHDSVERLRPTTDHTIELIQPAQELPALVDVHRIEQVVTNLLTNAIKYSPGKELISVQVVRDGDQARFEVRDRGIGIAEEDRERAFDRYYRAASGQNVAQGVGIGLYLSRALVERHGGQIGVDSEPGKGSTFWFTVPLTFEG